MKPQNVLLNDEGRAKVTDFGIARSLDAVGHTETGTVLGTSHYIAPEQARGEQIDAQTDIYSFGVVLYELLTGELPYPGDNFLTVAMKHVNDPSPSVLDRRPDTPLRLASLIERCMAKLPADRPASMDDVVAELEACLAELDAKDGGEGTMIMKRPKPAKPVATAQAAAAALAGRFPVLAALVGAAVARGCGRRDLSRDPRRRARCGRRERRRSDAQRRRRRSTPTAATASTTSEPALATDGNPATFWRTSTYRSQLSCVQVRASGSCSRPQGRRSRSRHDRHARVHRRDSGGRLSAGPVRHRRARARSSRRRRRGIWTTPTRQYYVVWITELVGSAHVNEVKAN